MRAKYASTATRATTSSNIYQNQLALTFQPESSARYLVLFSAVVDCPSAAGIDIGVDLHDGSNSLFEVLQPLNVVGERLPVGGVYALSYGASPSPVTLRLRLKGDGANTVGIDQQRLIALQLGADDTATAATTLVTATGTAYASRVSIGFTPSATDEYLLVGGCLVNNQSATAHVTASVRLYDGGHAATLAELLYINNATTTGYSPAVLFARATMTASVAQTVSMDVRTNAEFIKTRVKDFTVAAFRLGAFDQNNYAEGAATVTATATATFSDVVSLTATASAGNLMLVLAGGAANGNNTDLQHTRLVEAGSTVALTAIAAPRDTDLGSRNIFSADVRTAGAATTLYQLQTRHDDGGVVSYVETPRLFTLDLGAEGGTTTYFYDTFTEDVSVGDLVNHSPDIGTGWTMLNQDATTSIWRVLASSDNAQIDVSDATGGLIYRADPTTSLPAAQCIRADVMAHYTDTGVTNRPVGIAGRITATDTYYGLSIDNFAHVRFFKRVAGTDTTLGVISAVSQVGGEGMKLVLTDDIKQAWYNGSLVGETTDSAIASAGAAGFIAGTHAIDGAGIRSQWQLDNLLITDVATGLRHVNADAVLQKAQSVTTGLDAEVVAGTQTLTTGADAKLQNSFTDSADLDALLERTSTLTVGVDYKLQDSFTPTASFDAKLQGAFTATVSVDAKAQKAQSVTTGLDAKVKNTLSLTVGLDAASLGSTAGTADADLDAVLQKTFTLTVGVSAVLGSGGVGRQASIDAYLAKVYTPTVSLDAASPVRQRTRTVSFDGVLQAAAPVEKVRVALLGGYLSSANIPRTLGLDALVTDTWVELGGVTSPGWTFIGETATATEKFEYAIGGTLLDAVLSRTQTVDMSLGALLVRARSTTLSLDGIIQTGGLPNVSLDAKLRNTFSLTTGLDGRILTGGTTPQVTVDAKLQKARTATVSLHGNLALAGSVTVGVDGRVIREGFTRTANIDGLVQLQGGVTASASGSASSTIGTKFCLVNAILQGAPGTPAGGLRVAPPAMTQDPITVNFGTTGQSTGNNYAGRDVTLVLPTSSTRTQPIRIDGCRNLIVKGGRMVSNVSSSSGQAFLNIQGATGTVFIEGLYIDSGAAGSEDDAIKVGGGSGGCNVVIQNCHIYNTRGTQGGGHGDLYQAYGGHIKRIDIDKVTGRRLQYQGIFSPDQGSTVRVDGPTYLSRINMDHDGAASAGTGDGDSFLYWCSDGDDVHVHFIADCWGKGRSGSTAKISWPQTYSYSAGGGYIHYSPSHARMHGSATGVEARVYIGTPPAGDFCKTADCGLNYVSPGYGGGGTGGGSQNEWVNLDPSSPFMKTFRGDEVYSDISLPSVTPFFPRWNGPYSRGGMHTPIWIAQSTDTQGSLYYNANCHANLASNTWNHGYYQNANGSTANSSGVESDIRAGANQTFGGYEANYYSTTEYGSGSGDYDNTISGQTFTSALTISGSAWNNTIIRDCTFRGHSGDGILLRDVDNVQIQDCHFQSLGGIGGIRLSNSGNCTNIRIYNNTFVDLQRNGVISGESASGGITHSGARIIGNSFDNCAILDSSQGLYHSIYWQGWDFLIQKNYVHDNIGGNGISVRAGGQIISNMVDGAGKSGIAYYADHPKGTPSTLLIQDNVACRSALVDSGRADIELLPASASANVSTNLITGATLISNITTRTVEVGSGYSAGSVSVTANVIVSTATAQSIIASRRASMTADTVAVGDVHVPPPTGSYKERTDPYWSTTFRIPVGARPSLDGDSFIAILQPNGWVLECFGTVVMSNGDIVCGFASYTSAFSLGDGATNGRRASMIPVYAGILRNGELDAAQDITHALCIGLGPEYLAREAVYPALAFDRSPTDYAGSLPMGACLAIPPAVNLNALSWNTTAGLKIARALQTYGGYVTDKTISNGLSIATETIMSDQYVAAYDAGMEADLLQIVGLLKRTTKLS